MVSFDRWLRTFSEIENLNVGVIVDFKSQQVLIPAVLKDILGRGPAL